ncbi:MAG: N-acyl homoserine lactonase family protein [Deltaproteobacteria bacterium]|nr:N-acyl homoserine lactonase family protein [Deltaproteobacteria bacterium]
MRLYALSCGLVRCRKNVFVPDAPREEIIAGPMPVFVILHPKGNVLFDTGPNPGVFQDALARWGGLAKAFEPLGNEGSGILAQLKTMGLRPEDIRYVVNSHLHFDHAGGNQFFPKSIFLVSRKEMEWAQRPENEGKGYFRADWDYPLIYREIEGFFDLYGDGRLTVIPLPGHTPGHQGLLVRLPKDGAMILSGDSVPCKENYRDFKIPRNHLDGEQARKTIQGLRDLVEKEKALLIHGHDPEQWKQILKAPEYYQ